MRIECTSDPHAVREALIALRTELEPLNLSKEDRGRIETVLAEIMNNIAEHAYPLQNDGAIVMNLNQGTTGFFCEILDDGIPMPNKVLPAGNPADIDCSLEDLPEGGFGWFLIRSMTENLQYLRVENHNQLKFHLPTDPQP